MESPKDYVAVNQQMWNDKVDIHYQSAFYDVNSFIKGESSLNDIELELLGDISGKSVLHLQCHFGMDSISLQRLGAKVVAVDFSDKAILKARELAAITQADVRFICADIYELPNLLTEKFDIVFTSYGTIGWLPDMDKWAKVVSYFLKPKGNFVFAEFHPFLWTFDHKFENIAYDYFNTQPIFETEEGTYADKNSKTQHYSISWNHSISEVINSLINNGIEISVFNEYSYSPYHIFHQAKEIAPKKFRLAHIDFQVPLVYSIKGVKH